MTLSKRRTISTRNSDLESKFDLAFIVVWLVTFLLCIAFWGAVIFGIVKLVLHYT